VLFVLGCVSADPPALGGHLPKTDWSSARILRACFDFDDELPQILFMLWVLANGVCRNYYALR
jgi:hypothetical protein